MANMSPFYIVRHDLLREVNPREGDNYGNSLEQEFKHFFSTLPQDRDDKTENVPNG